LTDMVVPEVAASRRLRDALESRGYDVTYRETGGAHQDLHWRATLAEGLVALLGQAGAPQASSGRP